MLSLLDRTPAGLVSTTHQRTPLSATITSNSTPTLPATSVPPASLSSSTGSPPLRGPLPPQLTAFFRGAIADPSESRGFFNELAQRLPMRGRASWQHEHAQLEKALVRSEPALYNALQLQEWANGPIRRDRDIAIARRREQCAELIQRTALPWLYHPDGAMLARFIEQDGAFLEG